MTLPGIIETKIPKIFKPNKKSIHIYVKNAVLS